MSYRLRAAVLVVALTIVGVSQSAGAAPGGTVSAVFLDGQPQQSVGGVTVSMGQNRSTPATTSPGDVFESGSRIQTPRGVTLDLATANGNILRLLPNSDVRLAVSSLGERHTVNRGGIWARVVKKLSFFSITDAEGTFQGAAEGTVYGATVAGGKIAFSASEGTVTLSQHVPITVKGERVKLRENRGEVTVPREQALSAGQQDVSFAFFPAPEEYSSADEAVAALGTALGEAYKTDNKDLAADLHSALGGVYLDQGQADYAIQEFNRALELNYWGEEGGLDLSFAEDHTLLGYAFLEQDYPILALLNFRRAAEILSWLQDPYSPLVSESLLDQAEALYAIENEQAARDLALEALTRILPEVEGAMAVLDGMMETNDPAQWEVAIDYAWEVSGRIYSLGDALELSGDPEGAQEIFELAAELEALVDEWDAYADH